VADFNLLADLKLSNTERVDAAVLAFRRATPGSIVTKA
jgi:hypothetical protein